MAHNLSRDWLWTTLLWNESDAMIGENRQSVANEPVEFEK